MTTARESAERHVALFNECVRAEDFGLLLAEFTPDARVRFENVPGAGVLEFRGIQAIAAAYEQQPPDDQIDIAADPFEENGTLVVPFAWRADRSLGTMRLEYASGQLARMVVVFG